MPYGDIPASGSCVGIGDVNGQKCLFCVSDPTVKGGTVFPIGIQKQLKAHWLARKLKLPTIYLLASGGAFLPLQSEIFNRGGGFFYNEAILGSENVPQISVVLGNCTAGGAYIPTMCDDAIIVDKKGSLFLGGPPLVRAATQEVVTEEELGGATVHCSLSGCTDYFAPTEEDGIRAARDTVLSLNLNRPRMCDVKETFQSPLFPQTDLVGCAGSEVPGRHFCYQVLSRVLDGSLFNEFRRNYGSGSVCGFGFIESFPVGIVFSTGEGLDWRSAEKASHLVQLCDQRSIPIIFFQRSLQDKASLQTCEDLKAHSNLMRSVATAGVHKISVNVGNCYGSDYYSLCGRSFDPTYYFAWPNAELAMDPMAPDFYKEDFSAFQSAANLWLDNVILPQDTRKTLAACLDTIPINQHNQQQQPKSAAAVLRL